MMKRAIAIFSLVWLLNACSSQTNLSANLTGNPANCPTASESPPEINIKHEEDFYKSFQSHNILADADTLTVQTLKYDFIFCRANQTWSVKTGTFKADEPQNYEAMTAKLANPPYQKVELNGKRYQYRILLQPNPFPNFQQEPKQVVLEVLKPNQKQPQRQVLYTLDQVKQAKTGSQLGVPEITTTLIYDNRLFWSISPEQGEGNGGIATIASYHPSTDTITVIQPPEIVGQQIKDMAIAGESASPTFWLATQISGEGNPYLPSMGLVAYYPNSSNLKSGSVKAYHVRNSPLIGAIPAQLKLEDKQLWVATGNGICQLQWETADNFEGWLCWRFSLRANLPSQGVPLYSSLLNKTATATLMPDKVGEMVEVMWWSPQSYQVRQGRYEVRYAPGFSVKLDNQGAIPWSEFYSSSNPPSWEAPIYWPGKDWTWQGDRFVRSFDAVALNYFGGGPTGIGTGEMIGNNRPDVNAIRGDLDLLKLTRNSTEVKHYSGWVDERLLKPYITIIPHEQPKTFKPNPLAAITNQFK